jgi:hypothetical protein
VQQAAYVLRLADRNHLTGQLDVRLLETRVATPPVQNADEIDRGIRSVHECGQRRGIVNVDFGDLHGGQEYELLLRALPVARRHTHAITLLDERVADVPADKTAPA